MKEKNSKESKRVCQKCNKEIGGGAYYFLQLDCLYDGKSLSRCEKVVICSDCYDDLKAWLKLPKEPREDIT